MTSETINLSDHPKPVEALRSLPARPSSKRPPQYLR